MGNVRRHRPAAGFQRKSSLSYPRFHGLADPRQVPAHPVTSAPASPTTCGNRKFRMSLFSCPECPYFLVRTHGMSRDQIARLYIEAQISEIPALVGPPIDILSIGLTGSRWIQKKPECPEVMGR